MAPGVEDLVETSLVRTMDLRIVSETRWLIRLKATLTPRKTFRKPTTLTPKATTLKAQDSRPVRNACWNSFRSK